MKFKIFILISLSFLFQSDCYASDDNRFIDHFIHHAKERYQITVDYWAPKVRKGFSKAAEASIPKIRKSYAPYMQGPGQDVSRYFWESYDYLALRLKKLSKNTHEYYQDNHPITYTYLADIPAFIKRGYEKAIISIWQWLYTLDKSELSSLSADKMASVEMATAAAHALKSKNTSAEAKMLRRLLDEIRPGVRDYGMQDCYNVVLLEINMGNAFNIGCNIFFSKDLITMLKGDERLIRAVLAHEVSHGERGHGIKTLVNLMGSISAHYTELTLQELLWIATGEAHEKFKRVAQGEKNLDLIMENFAPKAPAIEIDADKHATLILENVGHSRQDLIDALEYLHAVTGSLDCDKERIESKRHRDYPTFCARKDAIEAAAYR